MLDILEVFERANTGEKMTEKEYDTMYFKKTEEVRQNHPEIVSPKNGEIIINSNNDVADCAFQAGIELLLETGAYCVTTNRIIKWTEEEIKDCLKGIHNEVTFGEAKDRRIFVKRDLEDRSPPMICPGFHAPYTEEIVPELIKAVAMIPEADIIEGCNFPFIEGHRIWGMPFEVYAAKRQLGWLREGVRRAGRGGMGIIAYPISSKAATVIATLNPEYGVRHTDGISLNPLNGQKVEYDFLAVAAVTQDYVCNVGSGGFPAGIGGYSGGPEGGAIGAVSAMMNALLAYRGNFGRVRAEWILVNKEREREAMWATSVAQDAITRNTNLPRMEYVLHYAGPCTEMCLQEVAAKTIAYVVAGAHIAKHTSVTVVPRWNNVQTPTEALWMIDVAKATARSGLKRDEANQIVSKLYAKFKDNLDNAPRGKGVLECYDLHTRTPSKEFLEIRKGVSQQLDNLGLHVSNR